MTFPVTVKIDQGEEEHEVASQKNDRLATVEMARATGVLRRLARALPHRAVSHPPVTTAASTSCATSGSWTPNPWTPRSLVRWMATVQANELRVGQVIERDGSLLRLTKVSYTQGQARAAGNVQVEWRNVRTGQKQSLRLSPSDKLDRANLDEELHVFLFQAGDDLVLMHPKTYDQVEVRAEVLGEIQRRFLTDNCEVKLLMHEGEIVSAALADEVEIEIQSSAPSMKGESISNQYKPAETTTGVSLKVPSFIDAGDVVVVNTKTGEFVRRAKR